MLNQDIVREATRLTRLGQLTEATALLQRMLRGENAPGAVPTTASRLPAARSEPPTVDAEANVADMRARPRTRRTPANRPKNFPGFGPGGSLRRAPPSMADIVPHGTSFDEGTYKNAAGSRAYRLFTPTGYHGQAIPLVIMLHGCTQSPEDFAAGTRMNFIAEENLLCGLPRPAGRSEQSKMLELVSSVRPATRRRRTLAHRWHHPPDHARLFGRSATRLRCRTVGRSRGRCRHGVHLQGPLAAIGIHSGLACGAATDLPSALMAMKQGGGSEAMPGYGPPIPTIVFHGDRDTTVHSKNGGHLVRQFVGATRTKMKVHRGQVPGGHAYTRTVHTDAGGTLEILEHWEIHGAGHAWSGGSPAGSYTDPDGPDATREMLRFFLEHSLPRN